MQPNHSIEAFPLVAVIIPAYKQPGLLGEAILSVLRQSINAKAVAVVVDDGCPFPETIRTAHSFSRAHPNQVFVLRQINRGLSAARNTGIAFALGAWPKLEAVMFLDADNRIKPMFLQRALAALAIATDEVGWVYPDIDMIGLPESWSMRGKFSVLTLLGSNYCDAGSVVRCVVLKEGLRFDENLRHGFEDWDFWLKAVEAGYRGQHLPMAGFQYRRRGESMLSGARRMHEVIVSAMNQKRRAFLLPRSLQVFEVQEAPRFAILHPEEDQTRFTHDPAIEGEHATLCKSAEKLRAFQLTPASSYFPPAICSVSRETLRLFSDALILASMFWLLQVLLRAHRAVAIFLKWDAVSEVRIRVSVSDAVSVDLMGAALVALRTSDLPSVEVLSDRTWRLWVEDDPNGFAHVEVELPAYLSAATEVSNRVIPMLKTFISSFPHEKVFHQKDWRKDSRPARNDLLALYEVICGVGALLPISRPLGSLGEIGFLIPVHGFGGVEKVVLNQARVLRSHGFRPHLFLSQTESFRLSIEVRSAFVSVNPLFSADFDRTVGSYSYFGAPMSDFERTSISNDARDILGLLCCMDVVINTHSLGGHGIASRLRQLGVRMMVGLHLVEHDPYGTPVGNPHSALAYEHSYDNFIVISKKMRTWCLAHGIPEEKLILVPNAPSYPQVDDIETVLALRSARLPGALRVLFLGRLDAQKGLDRVATLIRATAHENIEWRIIGAKVFKEESGFDGDLGITVEPALHEAASLDTVYDWADVLLLPSRFEGVPLTVLEAQRRGVVVVASDVGAMDEAVTAGAFLIRTDQTEVEILRSFLEVLQCLANDSVLLSHRANLSTRATGNSWEECLAPLLTVLSQR